MSKITPCLWFDGQAEEAAKFYVSVFPDSRIDEVMRSPAETPSGPEGAVLLVRFTIGGQPFTALNGGPEFQFSEAISFMVDSADQAEQRDRGAAQAQQHAALSQAETTE